MHTINLAEYLFCRLRQLGVESVHGVPGDFNLTLLDHVSPQGLHWVGNCNELNAGYAADGYARIKGVGALITTFGVGELSAINAIAGAYAELAPVVHIVGTPARHIQTSRASIHHTLNDGNFDTFAKMYKDITVAQTNLWDPRTAPEQVDKTLLQCLIRSRPVYIRIPTDMVGVLVDATALQTEITIPQAPPSANESRAIELLLAKMYASRQPMILIDGESAAYGILDEISELVRVTQWPTWTSIFGKGCVDESLPNVHGIWKGSVAEADHRKYIGSADLILCFGPHFSSTNTYGYSSIPDSEVTVHFKETELSIDGEVIQDLPSRGLLKPLIARLDTSKLEGLQHQLEPRNEDLLTMELPSNGLITQDLFYRKFSQFLRPGDIVLAETGTAGHGCRDFKLPPNTHLFKPATWLSIGYMLPAAQGAALAQRELQRAGRWKPMGVENPRTILLIGDGSFQMTVQELSTIIREQLNVFVFLLNNDGYTIERCIHGWDQQYNDVAGWRYLQAPSFLGANTGDEANYRTSTRTATTWGDLATLMQAESGVGVPRLLMAEVHMGRDDAPGVLATLLQKQRIVK